MQEYETEQDETGWFVRMLNRGYNVVSNYGANPLRALILYFFLLSVVSMNYIGDEAAISTMYRHEYKGWEKCIYDNKICKNISLAFQQSLGPIQMLSKKGLVAPREKKHYIFGMGYSVVSTIVLFLLILAVRRRFRLHG